MLEKVRHALLFQYRCTLRYAPPRRQAETYLFDPYTLLFYKDSLYLGGFAHNRDALRLFLVDRLQEIEVGQERFQVPDDFRVEDLTGSAFGLIDEEPMTIRVAFGSEIAHLVRERIWHPTQEMEQKPDGSLELTFRAGGEREILAWLYSYLPHVRVLDPPALKEAFFRGLRRALDD